MNIFKHWWQVLCGNQEEIVSKSALTPLTQTALQRHQLTRRASMELSDAEFWKIIGLNGPPPPPADPSNSVRRTSIIEFLHQTSVVLAFQDLPSTFKPRIQPIMPIKKKESFVDDEIQAVRSGLRG
ncbi:hypothetical protein THRCLA_22292 [Thraustotheca clavata]|uniref:Uncharacterized protein n=1 Tax=Thraustotheca clavata TaxID=74557 RepID=A0A1V9Z6M4_9STRA|nr:hypothetical protein THRCLA_22292 [Thraustotheca clavata]